MRTLFYLCCDCDLFCYDARDSCRFCQNHVLYFSSLISIPLLDSCFFDRRHLLSGSPCQSCRIYYFALVWILFQRFYFFSLCRLLPRCLLLHRQNFLLELLAIKIKMAQQNSPNLSFISLSEVLIFIAKILKAIGGESRCATLCVCVSRSIFTFFWCVCVWRCVCIYLIVFFTQQRIYMTKR
jgi:hypothetical protein